jgi:signal-transduction protein with cAMP-binding, CBS, and nucleotidyltransferase domain
MDTSVRIKEVMSTKLVTVDPESTMVEVAKKMLKNRVGSVIITENGDNEGILTERDICYKVVAWDKEPSKVLAKDVMTTNLVTIPSEKTITDAAKLMVKRDIRRLAVVEKGKIIGILTASDILGVSPRTIEILQELYEVYSSSEESGAEEQEKMMEGGTCDECAVFTDNLVLSNGRYLCDDCREELEG